MNNMTKKIIIKFYFDLFFLAYPIIYVMIFSTRKNKRTNQNGEIILLDGNFIR
jgi:hypothetical protein